MYKFQKLVVWQESINLAEICYKIASDLPYLEKQGLSDQLRRAVISVSLNIAEGSGSDTDKEFCRYLYLSRKSLFEVINILMFIEKLYPKDDLAQIYNQCDKISKLLNGLIKKLKDKPIS